MGYQSYLQRESNDSSGQRGTCTGPGVATRASMVQIRSHHLSLPRRSRTVGTGHGRGASLRIPRDGKKAFFYSCRKSFQKQVSLPGNESVFSGGADGQGPDGVGVPVAVAVVVVPAPVAAGPHEDGSLVPPALADAVEEGLSGHAAGTVHRLSVVVRTPTEKRPNNFLYFLPLA